ncbi:Hypothetical predicted protein [Pelobates cultripes]|uniref:Uncharacterized protein n=1 Tax=Pelobates cultripes TaxID=61616 RepID=A0AAD1VLB7_PELCU|nr:Hypothetical predicted protein [Pelobates cultripes]
MVFIKLFHFWIPGFFENLTSEIKPNVTETATVKSLLTDFSSVAANDVKSLCVTGHISLLKGFGIGELYWILIAAAVGFLFVLSLILCITSYCLWRAKRSGNHTVQEQRELVTFPPEDSPGSCENPTNHAEPKDFPPPTGIEALDIENAGSQSQDVPSESMPCLNQVQESTM